MHRDTDGEAARFHAHCQATGDGCLRWTGARSRSGHGLVRWHGRLTTARRIAWELAHGPIPERHRVAVTCRRQDCVSAGHLVLRPARTRPEDPA